jgi:hypothetical protein
MSIVISAPSVIVNNEPIAIVPNSLTYTEGKGEQNVRAASAGGGSVEQVYSENVETNFSMVKFEIYNDAFSIKKAREWKTNLNQNVVQISGAAPDGSSVERTFQNAGLLADYEVALGSETTIELDFKSDAAV